MLVCTTVTRRTLSWARRLDQSLARHSPGARLLVLVLDDRERAIDDTQEEYELVRPEELGIERFSLLAARLDETRLVRAVQPSLMLLGLERAGETPVIYLDPQTEVFADLHEFGSLATERGFAITPRFTEPIPRDGLRPTDIDALSAGIFDPGCLACAGGQPALQLLRTWQQRLRRAERHERGGAFLRWHDLIATLGGTATIVGDPGIGVSVWNLHERRLSDGDKGVLVNDAPLRTLCFAGLESAPDGHGSPAEAEPEVTRGPAFLKRQPLLARLATERADSLSAQTRLGDASDGYGFERLADGTPLTPRLREFVRLAESHAVLRRSPFTAAGTAELLTWLRRPTELAASLPRFWLFIYAERADLQTTFPDLRCQHAEQFLDWILETGEREYELPAPLRITSAKSPAD